VIILVIAIHSILQFLFKIPNYLCYSVKLITDYSKDLKYIAIKLTKPALDLYFLLLTKHSKIHYIYFLSSFVELIAILK